MVYKTNYRLMQVKSIAECSKRSILQYFRPLLSYHLSLTSFRLCFVYFWVAILHRFYCNMFLLVYLSNYSFSFELSRQPLYTFLYSQLYQSNFKSNQPCSLKSFSSLSKNTVIVPRQCYCVKLQKSKTKLQWLILHHKTWDSLFSKHSFFSFPV